MKRILAMAEKEAKQLYRDPLTLSVAVALPLVLIMLYGTALTTTVRNMKLLVDDEDNTPLSRSYIEAYAATNTFQFVAPAADAPPETMLDSFEARGLLRIPAGFERDWKRGLSPQVQLVVDGTDSNAAVVLRNIASAVSMSFAPQPVRRPVRLAVRFWYNPGLADELFFGSAALGLVLILFPALLGAIAVARELELGTILQAYASSLTAPEWVIGKALPYLVVGMAQTVLCFILGIFVFGYRLPEHVGPLALACLLYLVAGVLFGMMAGNLTGTQSAGIQAVQFGAFLLSLLISGFLVPIANMPVPLQWFSNVVPARHFIEVMRDVMLRGGGWAGSAKPLVALAALAAVFFTVNVKKLGKMRLPG